MSVYKDSPLGLFLFASQYPPRMKEELLRIAEAIAEAHQVHVIDLVVRGDRGRPVFEVYIDGRDPVTTDICTVVSREISAAVEARNLAVPQYRLEVSSPGIDRPLRHAWQYHKHVGRELRIRMADASGGTLAGALEAVDESGIVIRDMAGGNSRHLRFADMQEVRVAAPW
jgi:ribosome maturation factor RimP